MPTQAETLRQYLALTNLQRDWSGRLLLGIGLNEYGRTLALAALAAGAASLFLEEDPTRLRQAGRDVTFTVTTLDEALRALKNEIRQHRAISIALAGNATHWLNEIAGRGVRPDAIVNTISGHPMLNTPALTNIVEDSAATLTERRSRDMQLTAAYTGQSRWLHAAPTLFPRDLTRAYLLNHQ